MQREQRPARQGPDQNGKQIEHQNLMRDAAAGHWDDFATVELILALLPVFSGEEAVRGRESKPGSPRASSVVQAGARMSFRSRAFC